MTDRIAALEEELRSVQAMRDLIADIGGDLEPLNAERDRIVDELVNAWGSPAAFLLRRRGLG